MNTERYVFEDLKGVPEPVLEGLAADLAFCHPAIAGVVRIDPGEGSLSLAVVDDPAPDLADQVARVVGMSVASYRFVEPAAAAWVHEPAGSGPGRKAVAEAVRRDAIELGSGQYAFRGALAKLHDRMRERLHRLALGLGAEDWRLPSVEATCDLLPATGYFESHPQHVTFGFRLPPHFERIRTFATAARERRLLPVPEGCLEPAGFILAPVVCHNVYRALRGSVAAAGRTITAEGRCYRYEGFRFEPLLRQWEFTMREVVLVGPSDFVADGRSRCQEATCALVRELDLPARLEAATDPFFVSAAASARTFQALGATKLELRLGVGDGATTAGASFNVHDRHFTGPMEIRDFAGQPVQTACVGWGVERWVAAFVARWSADPAAWPSV